MEAIEKELENATEALSLRHPLVIENLLDSPAETVDNLDQTDQEIDESILQQFKPHEDPEDEEEEVQEVEIISHQDALKALERLHLYEMQQEDGVHGTEWVQREKKAVRARELMENGRKKEKHIDLYFNKGI